jgi:hypothetical protein
MALTIVDQLTRINRAYNLLYAFGESPFTVSPLTNVEVDNMVNMAQSAYKGEPGTFQELIRTTVKPALLRYVATGEI